MFADRITVSDFKAFLKANKKQTKAVLGRVSVMVCIVMRAGLIPSCAHGQIDSLAEKNQESHERLKGLRDAQTVAKVAVSAKLSSWRPKGQAQRKDQRIVEEAQ